MKLKDEEMKESIVRETLRPIANINAIGLVGMLLSPVVFIWSDSVMFGKVLLTASIVVVVSGIVHKVMKKITIKKLEEIIAQEESERQVNQPKKSSFQQKLEEMQKKQKP